LEVALEQAMACGMGTCKGCAVHDRNGAYKYVCSDGPVFQSGDVFGKGA
jgi:dihydroorotate dehydrogenase electron transfer subunit